MGYFFNKSELKYLENRTDENKIGFAVLYKFFSINKKFPSKEDIKTEFVERIWYQETILKKFSH